MADPVSTRRRFLAGAGALAGTAVLGACGNDRGAAVDVSERNPQGESWDGSIFLDPPFEKPDVTFTDVDGNPYPLREKTEGRLTILGFGYTNCPDICPIYLNSIAQAKLSIGSGAGSRPIMLFVGVDRERDLPKLKDGYLGKFDDSFIGLTATDEEAFKALDALKLGRYTIGPKDSSGTYEVAHDGRLTVFSPDNTTHRMYGPDTRARVWVRDLPRLDKNIYQ